MKKRLPSLLLLCLAACGQVGNGASPQSASSPAKAPPASQKSFPIEGEITSVSALEQIYGKMDPRRKVVIWKAQGVSKENSYFLPNGEQTWVSVLLAEKVIEGNEEKFYLLTQIVPKGFSLGCAIDCVSGRGAAIFVKHGTHWDIEAQSPLATIVSTGVLHAKTKLVALGPARHGFMWSYNQMDEGYEEELAFILGPQQGEFKEEFQLAVYEDNKADCSTDCFSYSVNLSFRPGPRPDRYDIIATTSGTKMDEDSHKPVKASAVETYRFDGQTYALTD